ncbi:DUF2269 family protein [Paenibacillus sp. LHD-38]|uniref:DUF2269 family protein n=1 Tax=Paenibacillus sp. LHD-38 TaxID=3072143 RepID=UPI0028103F95|nr:DUF2269 family protein [Paenibacillus sp. LHD-38]MDQ8734191.1 DUF2269 family protein [Paenibacillus sp. LHD-38]
MLFLYTIVLFIHVLAAVMGLGAAFGFPILARTAKTAAQARFTLQLLKNLEILPKAGSITLLLTGLIMGIMEPDLFTEVWFIASIAIYLITQIFVIGMLPRNMKAQAAILENHTGEELPPQYKAVSKQSAKIEGVTHLFAFLLIFLMVFQPF